MNKFFILFAIVHLSTALLLGQRNLPTTDHFNYTAGELQAVGTNWSRISGTSNDLFVVSGNLIYPNYPMASTGNQVTVNNGGTDDVKLTFTSQTLAGSKVYASFLLSISTVAGLDAAGAYFSMLGTGNTGFAARLFIRSDGSGFNLGLAKNSNTAAGWSATLSVGTTYLVVMYYEIVSGTNNDTAKLWINPDLSGEEPSPDISISSNTDLSINGFFIRQAAGTPTANIDAIRIADSWSNAPLPVELTSFTAGTKGRGVELAWKTATELNNYGFEVERKELTHRSIGSLNQWTKIGFVEGNGTTNTPKSYTFVDGTASGTVTYRLKQIDRDGSFVYSNQVEVTVAASMEFSLMQNHPNPFNPVTSIRYTLPAAGCVTLKVYDLIGKEVATLVNGVQDAGVKTAKFEASQLPSGVYFFTLRMNNYAATRKMMLVK